MDRMDNDKRAQTLRSMKADMFHQTADSLFYKHKKGNRRDDKTMKNAVQTEVTLMRTVSDSVTPTRFPLVSVPSVLVCSEVAHEKGFQCIGQTGCLRNRRAYSA
jgi:hypothetical protein